MSNDGGWCFGPGIGNQMYGHRIMPEYKLSQNPAHGTVTITPVPEPGKERTRVAYKPQPGFLGQDSFEVTIFHPAGIRYVSTTVTVK